jgi:hypothetical protein
VLIEGRQCSSGQRYCHSPTDSLSPHCGPQEDLFIDDEDLLEELAPLKDALERAVHRKNQVEQLKDQLEEEVRAFHKHVHVTSMRVTAALLRISEGAEAAVARQPALHLDRHQHVVRVNRGWKPCRPATAVRLY